MKTSNAHNTRESWLCSATNELRPYFEKLGYILPDKIRFAIAFTSGGKKGRSGEVWHPAASADGHYEIIIKADQDDPLTILVVLVHQLIHSILPSTVKHGKEFRDVALRVGLEGAMRDPAPVPLLQERLCSLAVILGPLPHAKLDFSARSDSPKRSGARMLKAECGASCGYSIRLMPKWANAGLPICPIDSEHGPLICDVTGYDADNTIPTRQAFTQSKTLLN
jgi:hypothetical protein